VVAAGDQITVKVLRVDEATGKIALGLKQLQDDPWSAVGHTYTVGQVRSGRVTRLAEFGAFVELEPGIEGLLPTAEAGLDRDADLKKALPIGTDVEVAILEADAAARRIRLSRKAVAQQREHAELREYAAREDSAHAPAIGSLADKLRDALNRR
jgi:ribosomal protein S1